MNILIKDFGNDLCCSNVDDLKEVLKEHYRGKSVSISNSSNLIFIDVLNDGSIQDTYTRESISFDSFTFADSRIKY